MTKEIKVQITPEEYEKIKAKADAKGMSVRAYAKHAVLHRRDSRKKEAADLSELIETIERHSDELSRLNEQLGKVAAEKPGDGLAILPLLEEMALLNKKLEREYTQLMVSLGGVADGNP